MKKRLFLFFILAFVSISSFSINLQPVNDPLIIYPPIKTAVIQIVEDRIDTVAFPHYSYLSVYVLHI